MTHSVTVVHVPQRVVVTHDSKHVTSVRASQRVVVRADSPSGCVVRAPHKVIVRGAGAQGPAGPPGPPADRITAELVAGEILGGHRVVTIGTDSRAYYADNQTTPVPNGALWVTIAAALEDELVTVVTFGPLTEPTWTWTPGRPVFLGTAGMLTQTPPSGAGRFLARVGVARAADTLHVERFPSIILK